MSLFTSSLVFPGNSKDQGFFSTASAFKKPAFSRNFKESPNVGGGRAVPSIHPKDIAMNQPKPIQGLDKNEDCDLIMYEPVKKVKPSKVQPVLSYQSNNNKSHHHRAKPLRLTIEDVFNAPLESEQNKKERLMGECFDEGSSLSFISSCSSLDNLDEDSNVHADRKSSDCVILEPIMQAQLLDTESLVMKDDVVRRLSYLNQENILFSQSQNPLVLFPFSPQIVFEQPQFLKTLPVEFGNTEELICNVPLSIPPSELNEYIRSTMHSQFLQQGFNLSDKTIGEFVKNSAEEEYDSDSYATRSTSVERDMANAEGEKSQKGASPFPGSNFEPYQQEKISIDKLKAQVKEQKAQKIKKQGKRAGNKAESKEKKGRSLNLRLDLNPKQLKVERRLNRLQLLRYQQGDLGEEDEEIKKFGIIDLLNRTNSTNTQEPNPAQGEPNEVKLTDNDIQNSFNQFISEFSKATVPSLGEESIRKKRTTLVPKWTPENLQEQEFEVYFQMLEDTLETKVTDQEAAIKLLTSVGNNISLALETVRENKVAYSEIFRLKIKRLRRRGA